MTHLYTNCTGLNLLVLRYVDCMKIPLPIVSLPKFISIRMIFLLFKFTHRFPYYCIYAFYCWGVLLVFSCGRICVYPISVYYYIFSFFSSSYPLWLYSITIGHGYTHNQDYSDLFAVVTDFFLSYCYILN